MIASRRIRAVVKSGGKIEVVAPELKEGQAVEVIIEAENAGTPRPRTIQDVLAQCDGRRAFKNAAEVDAYIREERDAWDR